MKGASDMEKKESMGAIIRRLRTEKGWTQETLAERLHLTAQAVSRWETEQSLPDVSQLPLLARALGVTTDTLYGMDEPEEDDLTLNANMVYVPWDTERALKHWERMAEHLRAGDPGPESSNFRWTFLSLSVNLTDPESPIYVPERAEDIRAAALSLGRDFPKREEDRFLQDQHRRSLARLHALSGQQKEAFDLLGVFPFIELSQFQPVAQGELWRLLGDRKMERQGLAVVGSQAVSFLLDTLYAAGDNALALGAAGRAGEAAETALRLIPLLCGREENLPPLHIRPRGDLYGLLARARALSGDWEGALAALEEMTERRLALLSGAEQGVANALLTVSPNPFHTSPEGRPYHLARLRRELEKPELRGLAGRPEWAALLARLDAPGEE